MLHMGISNHTKEFTINYLSSDGIMFHPGSPGEKLKPFRQYRIHITSASNFMLKKIEVHLQAPLRRIDFSNN